MAIINLRRYYPHYPKDKFMDVPDEVAAALEEGRQAEHNRESKWAYHHIYSINRSPSIEDHAMLLVLSPERLTIQSAGEVSAALVLANPSATIPQFHPVKARRIHVQYALKKKFREFAVDEEISGSCSATSVAAAVDKLQKFFIKNGWMSKEV